MNETLQDDLRKERSLNEKILERVDKVEDENLKKELLGDIENLRSEIETSTLPLTEMQARLSNEIGILNDEDAVKSVRHVFYNRPPPSRDTLHNYLRKFIEKDGWIFDEKKDFNEFKESIDRYEAMKLAGDDEEEEATAIQPVMDPKTLMEMEWCQDCDEIYSVDTYPAEEKDPSLVSFYVDTPDLVREGRANDLPRKPYLSEITILKKELKRKRRKLSDLTTKMASLKETRHFYRKQFMYFAHLDSVRKIQFHPAESAPLLFSCSDDATIKMWTMKRLNLVGDRKNLHECHYTFRGHIGPVYDLIAHPDDILFSGGHDGTVRLWKVPNERENWERSTKLGQLGMFETGVFKGHKDVVWSIAQTKSQPLLSCSSDRTIRAWDWRSMMSGGDGADDEDGDENGEGGDGVEDLFRKNVGMMFKYECEEGRIPTVIKYRPFRNEHVIIGHTDGTLGLFDIEKQKPVSFLKDEPREEENEGEAAEGGPYDPLLVYDLIGLGTEGENEGCLFRNMVVGGHEDGVIRVYDLENGKVIQGGSSTMRHKVAVSGLSESPFSPTVVSVSHDCSIRQWDLKKFSVVQDFSEGRNKGDEGINCVQYHPNLDWIMATGSSDAIVKLFYSNLAPEMTEEEKEAHEMYQKAERKKERRERRRREKKRKRRKRSKY